MIRKENWATVKFGDVVRLYKERSADPAADGIERYVGIEHIKPEDLRIRNWGSVAAGTTFTRRFKPEHVLFVKRRAYQRKVAVADFAGVCSGDIYVLEPKDGRLLPELLPFICQTNAFFAHAVNTSAGSLSPRTNWKRLSQYEFALPPLAEQRRIARVLWRADELVEAQMGITNALNIVKKSTLRNIFSRCKGDCSTVTTTLGEIGNWESGSTPSKRKKEYWDKGTVLWVTPKDVKSLYLNNTQDCVNEYAISQGEVSINSPGAFVVVWRSGILQHSLPIARIEREFTFNQDIKTFKAKNNEIKSEYVRYFLQAFDQEIRMRCVKSGTTVQSIATSVFHNYEIPLPSVTTQLELVDIASQLDVSIHQACIKMKSSQDLKQLLLNLLLLNEI